MSFCRLGADVKGGKLETSDKSPNSLPERRASYAALLNETSDGRLLQEDNRLAMNYEIVCQTDEPLYVGGFPLC